MTAPSNTVSDPLPSVPVRVFIQARMSSSRYPGKVLAPLHGRPVIDHVVSACAKAVGVENVVVLTSTDPTDDPLAAYLTARGTHLFRGDLDDVFDRYRACLAVFPCDWMVRICSDSPVIDEGIIKSAVGEALGSRFDLVTNTFPRSFPRGQSVEVIRTSTFQTIDAASLNETQREHLTQVYYNRSSDFLIANIRAETPSDVEPGLSLDDFEDYQRLAALRDLPRFPVKPGLDHEKGSGQ